MSLRINTLFNQISRKDSLFFMKNMYSLHIFLSLLSRLIARSFSRLRKNSIIDFYAHERIMDLDLNKCLLNIYTLVNDLHFFQNTGLHSCRSFQLSFTLVSDLI